MLVVAAWTQAMALLGVVESGRGVGSRHWFNWIRGDEGRHVVFQCWWQWWSDVHMPQACSTGLPGTIQNISTLFLLNNKTRFGKDCCAVGITQVAHQDMHAL